MTAEALEQSVLESKDKEQLTAIAQALVPVIALIIWKPQVTSVEAFLGMLGVFGVNGFFVALFVGSAMLFRHAARERTPADAGQEG